MPPIYDASFKALVLEYYQREGPKEASLKFDLKPSIIQKWRRDAGVERVGPKLKKEDSQPQRRRRRQYDLAFKEAVLTHFRLNGEDDTCSKFQINSNLIYAWRKKQASGELRASHPFHENSNVVKSHEDIVKENEILSYQNCSDDKKKEVVRYLCQHGRKATMEKYKITNPKRLTNWSRKFRSYFKDLSQVNKRKISREEVAFREKVLSHSQKHGVQAASEKFNVSKPKIWDWRTKAKKAAAKLVSCEYPHFVDIGETISSPKVESNEQEDEEEEVEDFKFNPISFIDMMHVDKELRSQSHQDQLQEDEDDLKEDEDHQDHHQEDVNNSDVQVKIEGDTFLCVEFKIDTDNFSSAE